MRILIIMMALLVGASALSGVAQGIKEAQAKIDAHNQMLFDKIKGV